MGSKQLPVQTDQSGLTDSRSGLERGQVARAIPPAQLRETRRNRSRGDADNLSSAAAELCHLPDQTRHLILIEQVILIDQHAGTDLDDNSTGMIDPVAALRWRAVIHAHRDPAAGRTCSLID